MQTYNIAIVTEYGECLDSFSVEVGRPEGYDLSKSMARQILAEEFLSTLQKADHDYTARLARVEAL